MAGAGGLTSRVLREAEGGRVSDTLIRIACGFVLPVSRKIGMSLLGRLGRIVHPNLCLFTLFWCVTAHALAVPLALGSSDSMLLAAVCVCTDAGIEVLALWNVVDRDFKLCGRTILSHEEYVMMTSTSVVGNILKRTTNLLDSAPTPHQIATYESRWMLTFVAFEQGDMLAPCMLLTGWLTIYFSRHRNAFAGIGDDFFGWQRPDSIDGTEDGRAVWFGINVLMFVLLEGLFAMAIGVTMRSKFRVNLRAAQQWLLRCHGWELMVQSIVAAFTCFCGLHITCGNDISFELQPYLDPWRFFLGDDIPVMYHERGFPEVRPP
eukprot:TRINITY_DN75743_c0_g1_i1.p1 TRINITY_DN75743_c0_g1~~TRINITY_DN75743_c0_g1_i1.p1  ORF type:complete len:368 (+),score=18.18 TRINITY_DN75743_c0_g1_i1:145-1104(+)